MFPARYSPTLLCALLAVLSSSAWAASVDGYGNPMPTDATTGNNYPYANLGENPNNPYIGGSSANAIPIGPLAPLQSSFTFSNNFVGAQGVATIDNTTTGAEGYASIAVIEGSNSTPGAGQTGTVIDNIGSSNSYVVIYNNYAGEITVNNDTNATAYIQNNTVDGATLNNTNGSSMSIIQNSADDAIITNSGNSAMTINGNTVDGATINNAGASATDASTIVMSHNSALNATIHNQGQGTIRFYGDNASGATITTDANSLTYISDCSAAAGCLDTRGTTANNVTYNNNGRTIISGTIEFDNSHVTNTGTFELNNVTLTGASNVNSTATGYVEFAGINLLSAAIQNDGRFAVVSGQTTMFGNLSGAGGIDVTNATLVLNASGNTYAGPTTLTSGLLQAGAANAFSPNSPVNVDAASVFNANGYSQTVGTLTNAGLVATNTNRASVGATLTVTGNYIGQGGALTLSAALGGSNSVTDQLVVQGSTSGSTTLTVNNVGGAGGQTSGNGIRIVQVGGASNGAFRLGQGIAVGAYDYLLYQGGIGASANDGNWYLRSTYQTSVPAYLLTPALNAQYGFDVLGTLHQRVGNAGATSPDGTNADGVWGRVYGNTLNLSNQNIAANSSDLYFQFGKDWTLASPREGGSTHAGVMFTVGSITSSFSDASRGQAGLPTGVGSLNTNAQSLGGYWTLYRADGTYADTVGQVTRYSNRYQDATGIRGTQHGYSIGLSEEIGKPFDLGSITIEPQGQLMYQYLNLRGFEDAVGAVSGSTNNLLRGRVGVSVYPSASGLSAEEQKSRFRPYLQADLLHDFIRPNDLNAYGSELSTGLNRTWFDVGLGISTTTSAHHAFYASVAYLHELGGQGRDGVQANLGYRYQW